MAKILIETGYGIHLIKSKEEWESFRRIHNPYHSYQSTFPCVVLTGGDIDNPNGRDWTLNITLDDFEIVEDDE